MIVTHDDIDHTGGMRSVLEAMPVGWVATSLDASRVDYLVCGGYKWLLAPHGTGFLYVRKAKIGGDGGLAVDRDRRQGLLWGGSGERGVGTVDE